ncbi:LysR family transcriptional regulator [Cronobacter sakazakii]|nr:LysR family transcriptional regulator [Cronobacter sakazakii]ALB52775.1 LysR family transcriptional regulator [Cronobacter sakazakii]MDT3617605.1 LysR family transcriptional regulator [Cronobacter sakazakii]CCK03314.1 Putative LysR-family transcriptional regulatory protein [Cronobacter sakazakii 701]CCK07765.1 Putative LysR-family transcriptional regulatory protein [Cronobacter sakazakii 696]
MNLLISKKLKYFIVCFEAKCINSAAEQLCVTRSPLARVIYEMEEKMGGKLFIRKYNYLEPTELAITLYEKIKPVYDLLYSIENDFSISAKCSRFELLCDISVPLVIYQHILSWLKKTNQPVCCRRVSVSCADIQSLHTNPDAGILSFREIAYTDNLIFHKASDESIFLLMPETLHVTALKNFNSIRNVSLLIRKDVFSNELKGIISNSIKSFIPHVDIIETDRDTASILISVSSGEGMMLLPECLTSFFSPPGVKKIKIPDIRIQSGLYINKKHKSTAIVSDIMQVLAAITKQAQ